MRLQLTPFTPVLGALATSIDLPQPLDNAAVRAVEAAVGLGLRQVKGGPHGFPHAELAANNTAALCRGCHLDLSERRELRRATTEKVRRSVEALVLDPA